MTYDAIVIGGGIVGISAAYHLVHGGAKTLLIDREHPGRATDAGAGILAAATNTRDPDAWCRFATEAFEYYAPLIERLKAGQDGETGFAVCGKLTVAVSGDEIEPFEEAKDLIFRRQKQRGKPDPEHLYETSSEEARNRFPPLAPVHGAIYDHRAARVDGRLLAGALRRAAEARGLAVKRTGADRLHIDNGAVAGVEAGGESYAASGVAIAGGAWSPAFGEQLGVRIPVEPQRGQIVHLNLPGTDTSSWPIVSAFRGHYMVPWPDERVVAGATRETGSGFCPHTTAAGVREVLDEALRVAPGLAGARIREIRVGLRPLADDGLPVLGPVPGIRNIYLATGHGPTGLQLGPYSGKLVADLILGKNLETDISAFLISRFS